MQQQRFCLFSKQTKPRIKKGAMKPNQIGEHETKQTRIKQNEAYMMCN